MRGNQNIASSSEGRAGSIPAYAGEPGKGVPDDRNGRVYPRVCGGTGVRSYLVEMGSGLSPRMRGNRASDTSRAGWTGSIPAYAGEPTSKPDGWYS